MTEAELAAQLQLSGEQARIIYDATQKAALPTAKAAADTYRGLAFRQLDRDGLLSPLPETRCGFSLPSTAPSPRICPSIPIDWISPKACVSRASH